MSMKKITVKDNLRISKMHEEEELGGKCYLYETLCMSKLLKLKSYNSTINLLKCCLMLFLSLDLPNAVDMLKCFLFPTQFQIVTRLVKNGVYREDGKQNSYDLGCMVLFMDFVIFYGCKR